MIKFKTEMLGPRKEISALAEKYNLHIRKIEESPNGNYDVTFVGSALKAELFHDEVIQSGDSFGQWLCYSKLCLDEVDFGRILDQAIEFAHRQMHQYRKAGTSEWSQAAAEKWDEIDSHLRLARNKLIE